MNATMTNIVLQSLVGTPARTHNDHALHNDSKLPSSYTGDRVLSLPSRSQHHPITLGVSHRQHIPLFLIQAIFWPNLYIPFQRDNCSFTPNQHNLLPRLALRLLVTRSRRLPDVRPRKVLQTPTCHVSPHYPVPTTIPSVKILYSACCYGRRCLVHSLPPIVRLEITD